MLKASLAFFSCCVVIGSLNCMFVRDGLDYNIIDSKLNIVNQSWKGIRNLNSVSVDQRDLVEIFGLLSQLQVKFSHIMEEGITPECAGDIVRNLKLSGDKPLLDESSSDALINSLKRINKTMLEQNGIVGKSRSALLLVLECYANAVPGELTYPYGDEEQADIIDTAIRTYEGIR